MVAPAITGAESRNEIWALVLRVSPKNKAAVMVIPLRDTPGIKAKACAQPIKKTVLNGVSNKSVFEVAEFVWRSAYFNKAANTIKLMAIHTG